MSNFDNQHNSSKPMAGNRRQVPTKAPKWMLIEHIYGDKSQKRERYDELMEKSLDILKEIARENEIWTYKKKLDVSDVDNVRARLLPRVQLEQRFELLEGKDVNAAGRHPEADMKESLAIIIKRAWNSYIEERDASASTDDPPKDPTHDWTNIVLRQDSI